MRTNRERQLEDGCKRHTGWAQHLTNATAEAPASAASSGNERLKAARNAIVSRGSLNRASSILPLHLCIRKEKPLDAD